MPTLENGTMNNSEDQKIFPKAEIKSYPEGDPRNIRPEQALAFIRSVVNAVSSGDRKRVDEVWQNPVPLRMKDERLDQLEEKLLVFHPLLISMNNGAIENGADLEKAFALSESCSRALFQCNTAKESFLLIVNSSYRFCGLVADAKGRTGLSPMAREIEKYVNIHILEKITADHLTAALAVSRRQLFRIFQNDIGMPMSRYINVEKLRRSAALLQTGDYTSSEVSNYLGFASQSYFTKLFTEEYGCTPTAYRKLTRS